MTFSPHLHNLPWHVEDAACCSAEEASQAGDGAVPDHSSPDRLSFTIQQPPSLLSLLPLPQLQLPLFLMVTQPNQTLFLWTDPAKRKVFCNIGDINGECLGEKNVSKCLCYFNRL